MRPINQACSIKLSLFAAVTLFVTASVNAQTTQFSYQGKLADAGSPAGGQYDFQFKLFDTATVGTGVQQGGTVAVSNVTVTAGIFTVQIDFGAGVFPGAGNRFLEIAVKQTSGSIFTTLSPRQPVTANPYAIRSLNSTTADGLSVSCVNCVTSSQIQSVQGSQLTGSIAGSQISGLIPVASVPSGNANYIQNTTSLQATSNFNISGSGTAAGTLSGNIVTAATQYNIGGARVLTSNGASFTLIAGVNAGTFNTGIQNAFVGANAGTNNTTGTLNSFFGSFAGNSNTTGQQNSFFGQGAGTNNTIASDNSFFGFNAGFSTTSAGNSFFGSSAGDANTIGSLNSFFGQNSGKSNTTGSSNSFFGQGAGLSNTTATANSFFGFNAGSANTAPGNSFFGSNAGAANTTGDGNSFFGTNAGQNNTTGTNNAFFGRGAGFDNLDGAANAFFGYQAGNTNTHGHDNTLIGNQAGLHTIGNSFDGSWNTFVGSLAGQSNTAGAGNTFFGYQAGNANIDGGTNCFFGFAAGSSNTTGDENVFVGRSAGIGNLSGVDNTFIGDSAGFSNTTGDNNTTLGIGANVGAGNLNNATAIGAFATVSTSNTIALGRSDGSDTVDVPGKLQIDTLATAGSTNLCLNGSNRVGMCSSSLRYKTNLKPFASGLSIINRLHPITFTWTQDGKRDLGLGAEDVASVEPLLTFTNSKGEIEGVKYNQLGAVFINAFKEQQEQIKERERQAAIQQQQIEQYRKQLAQQQQQMHRQQEELDNLKRIVCFAHPKAAACKAGGYTR